MKIKTMPEQTKLLRAATSAATSTTVSTTVSITVLASALTLLPSCATLNEALDASLNSSDPASLAFSIPPGSSLELTRELPIEAHYTHATIQYGKLINDNEREFYYINCRLDFREFGPRTIQPERFRISRTEDSSNWISQHVTMRYYTEVFLESSKGTDVIKMVCQEYGSQTDNNFTVAEMQKALGNILVIHYPQESGPAK